MWDFDSTIFQISEIPTTPALGVTNLHFIRKATIWSLELRNIKEL